MWFGDGGGVVSAPTEQLEKIREALGYARNRGLYLGPREEHAKIVQEEIEIIRALALMPSLIERVREMEWQPIETAPKDGTEILLYGPSSYGPRVTVGHWMTDKECQIRTGDCGGDCRCDEYEYCDPIWTSWDGGFTTEWPCTHWMPLPNPPAESGGGVSKHTGIYRVRRGWFGKSVLQELLDSPSFIGGLVDASVRDFHWQDVAYREAPRALVSQFCEDVARKFKDELLRRKP